MELELTRVDYTIVGVTLPGSMKLIAGNTSKQPQKVAVADQDGVVQLFSVKKNETQIHFKTLPGTKIAAMQLGGTIGTIADKIFTASGNTVKAYNKKGKMFLAFETNLTESIKTMFVVANDLIVCGNHIYNHYKDCKNTGSYLCGDMIVDVAALCPNNTNRIITALACSGRVLRLLEHCRVRQSIELSSVPTVLHVPKGLGDKLICGFSDGRVVLFKIGPITAEVTQVVLVSDNETASAITSLDTYDLFGNGKDVQLLVGRRDGTVQVFHHCFEDAQSNDDVQQIFNENYGESISSIQGGCVGASGYSEIVVCTYSGRLFGLTAQCIGQSLGDASNIDALSGCQSRIAKLTQEVKSLSLQVAKEREKYQMCTQALSMGLSAIPLLTVNDSMTLCKEDASYILCIEVAVPLENVMLQSDVPIDLIDMDTSTAVVSFSECDPLSGNCLLATLRCQSNTNRVEMKIRTIEGQHGTLQAYVTPNLQPKCCQLRKYVIRPLSHHMRSHTFDSKRPYNTLKLKGSFSRAEMQNWLHYCVPEVPDKPESDDISVLTFANVFTGTALHCTYGKGEAEFRSDNISTISILKDILTKEATKKRIKLAISTQINDDTIPHMIKRMEPQLLNQIKLNRDHKLLQTLLDLDVRNDIEHDALSNEFKAILANRMTIERATAKEPLLLSRLYGLLTDLLIDRFKLKGADARKQVATFIGALENYNFDKIMEIFAVKEHKSEEFV